MAVILKLIGAAGLALTVVPAVLVALGQISLDRNKTLMLAGMVLWFVSAPLVRRVEGK